MRITGGKWRGKSIEARPERTLRPTSSMVREAIFNLLRHGKFLYEEDYIADANPSRVEERRVLDLFCGTGALALEALSRGAAQITLVDQDRQTLAMARHNVENLGAESLAKFIRNDSTKLPRSAQTYDLVFIDPPYNQNLAGKALQNLLKNHWLEQGALVVVEQSKKDAPIQLNDMQLLSDRLYDKTRILVLQYQPEETEASAR